MVSAKMDITIEFSVIFYVFQHRSKLLFDIFSKMWFFDIRIVKKCMFLIFWRLGIMLERFLKVKSFGFHISKPKKIALNILFDISKRSKSFPLMDRSKSFSIMDRSKSFSIMHRSKSFSIMDPSKSFPLMKQSKYKNIKLNKTYRNMGKQWLRIQEGQFLKSA